VSDAFQWKRAIVELVAAKQQLETFDVEKVWPYTIPRVRCSPEQLTQAEELLGEKLDSQYREFLLHANGWRAFFHDVDLFGVEELLGGGLWSTAQERLEELETEGTLGEAGLSRADVIPIAVSDRAMDVFLIGRQRSKITGRVIWFAGYEIEQFSMFEEFFLSMTECHREEVKEVRAKFAH
jgi:hypothetical protein